MASNSASPPASPLGAKRYHLLLPVSPFAWPEWTKYFICLSAYCQRSIKPDQPRSERKPFSRPIFPSIPFVPSLFFFLITHRLPFIACLPFLSINFSPILPPSYWWLFNPSISMDEEDGHCKETEVTVQSTSPVDSADYDPFDPQTRSTTYKWITVVLVAGLSTMV